MKDTEIQKIKSEILGKRYELSFSFISKDKIRELNKKYRGKDEPTDILSFPLDKTHGEILICREMADKKFKKFRSYFPSYLLLSTDYLFFLVIHGCLHLKGLKHGVKMKEYELSYYSRHRRRHL